jgi:hypothetical protein
MKKITISNPTTQFTMNRGANNERITNDIGVLV